LGISILTDPRFFIVYGAAILGLGTIGFFISPKFMGKLLVCLLLLVGINGLFCLMVKGFLHVLPLEFVPAFKHLFLPPVVSAVITLITFSILALLFEKFNQSFPAILVPPLLVILPAYIFYLVAIGTYATLEARNYYFVWAAMLIPALLIAVLVWMINHWLSKLERYRPLLHDRLITVIPIAAKLCVIVGFVAFMRYVIPTLPIYSDNIEFGATLRQEYFSFTLPIINFVVVPVLILAIFFMPVGIVVAFFAKFSKIVLLTILLCCGIAFCAAFLSIGCAIAVIMGVPVVTGYAAGSCIAS